MTKDKGQRTNDSPLLSETLRERQLALIVPTYLGDIRQQAAACKHSTIRCSSKNCRNELVE
ncbi:MAG: hypothetical protein HWQ35_29500 [Nostoc sp. NMS1]|uniref:hypothetical protein n=1 Tax=unclassified Nostoc TaxID=2593658 RepID=UPI0025E9AA20|nr:MULTISPECIES: hypothetical protein [unclassified Nostoc]MBN3910526.1 hypothetical protein [Nostoc sp. NMS1]MBN3989572.1 hypothetical protein [Nostoc sp. NMS2]